jgi:NADH-quinone oxidoreductase subunit N
MTELFRSCGPELVLLGVAGLLILAEIVIPRQGGRTKGYVAFLGIALAFPLLTKSLGPAPEIFHGAWIVDYAAVIFKMVLLVAASFVILMSIDEYADAARAAGEFYILTLLAIAGMMVMISGNNLLVVYLGLELMAICFYILSGYNWLREDSSEGFLKYVLTGLFASALLLYGISFLYGATGTVDLLQMGGLLGMGGYPRVMAIVGIAFVTCGLAFKMGAAPFHMWMPDVLDGAPTSVAGFLAVAPKVAVLAVTVRLFLSSFEALHELWGPLLWTIAALTILWGNLAAIAQTRVKRMLAYSSIAHVGYLLIAMAAAGKGTEEGISAIVFYLVVYSFMNLGAFGTLLWFERKTGEAVTWKGLGGIGRRAPGMSFLFSLFMFSLAGIPPTAGFIGKFWIFLSGWHAGYYGLVLIGALGSLIGAFYYLRTIYALYMLPEEEGPALGMGFSPLVYAVVLAAVGVLLTGVMPSYVMALARRALF